MTSPQPSYRFDEEDSIPGSPGMHNGPNFDLTSYFLALANPDFSSSSSESQSGASRGTTPSDWIAVQGLSQQQPQPGVDPSWKWDADALTGSIDPNALLLDPEHFQMSQAMPPPVQDFHFDQPPRDMMTMSTQLPSQFQEQQSQLQYLMQQVAPPASLVTIESQDMAPQPSYSVPATLQVPTLPNVAPVAPSGAHVSNDFDAIGRRARELVGVTYAMTPAQHAEALRRQSLAASQQQLYPPSDPSHPETSYPTPSQGGSSPTPSRSSGSSPTMPAIMYPYQASGSGGPKTKTSHTTIERRYRTNLNARIVALRHAVPALRILEKDKFPNEVVDERGFVDGVKAARKASKGSILGKAAEYIGVLKRREVRLRRDYAGLRALLCGLVGGPELFAEWERAWREEHPDEDEEGSDVDGDDEDGGSEDEDEKPRKKARVASTASAASARAPLPTAPIAVQAPPPMAVQAEKRKRGRPRKNASSSGTSPVGYPTAQMMPQTSQDAAPAQAHAGAGTYLFGIFALFTFFNPSTSPATTESSSAPHKHVGTVLNALNTTLHSHPAGQYVASSVSTSKMFEDVHWVSVVQWAHAIVTVLLFLAVAKSFSGHESRWTRFIPNFLSLSASQTNKSPRVKSSLSSDATDASDLRKVLELDNRQVLARALRSERVGVFDLAGAIMSALGVFAKASVPFLSLGSGGRRGRGAARVNEEEATRRAAVVRLAELDLMHRDQELSVWRRVFHFARLYTITSPAPSSSELVTMAMLASGLSSPLGLAQAAASSSWSRAQQMASASGSRDKQLLIAARSLEDAVVLYARGHHIVGAAVGGAGNGTLDGRITPLGLIASAFACEEIKNRASALFEAEIPDPDEGRVDVSGSLSYAYAGEPPSNIRRRDQAQGAESAEDEVSMEDVVMLGRNLTKRVRDLTHTFEDVTAGIQPTSRGVSFLEAHEDEEESDEDVPTSSLRERTSKKDRDAYVDATAFLEAIILYRRIVQASGTGAGSMSSSMTTPSAATAVARPLHSLHYPLVASTSTSSLGDSSGPNTPLDTDSGSDSDFDSPLGFEVDIDHEAPSSDSGLTSGTDRTIHMRTKSLALGKGIGRTATPSVGSRLALRRMLGSKTFASASEIEDARDRMVDYLVDTVW